MTNRELTAVDPLAHVKRDDPDPTVGHVVRGCQESDNPWLCTREADHPGQHIAGNGSIVVAVWPGTDSVAVELEARINGALSLLDRFETPGDRGRVQALIGDLRQVLAGA